jgi:hypothetical protein
MAISNVIHSTPAASAAQAQPVAKPPATALKSAQVQQVSQVPTDTVQISNAAKTALQELTESRSQTAQEAARGDRQAQKLLAKETVAQSSQK